MIFYNNMHEKWSGAQFGKKDDLVWQFAWKLIWLNNFQTKDDVVHQLAKKIWCNILQKRRSNKLEQNPFFLDKGSVMVASQTVIQARRLK